MNEETVKVLRNAVKNILKLDESQMSPKEMREAVGRFLEEDEDGGMRVVLLRKAAEMYDRDCGTRH